jgi:hypothetical protein
MELFLRPISGDVLGSARGAEPVAQDIRTGSSLPEHRGCRMEVLAPTRPLTTGFVMDSTPGGYCTWNSAGTLEFAHPLRTPGGSVTWPLVVHMSKVRPDRTSPVPRAGHEALRALAS